MIYEPQDDSYLLEKEVKKATKKGMRVLDMGTGSGIHAFAAAEQGAQVTAVDINPTAVAAVKEQATERGLRIKAVQSDLFAGVKGRFDLIIFNPPYLPAEMRDPDVALDGGPIGHELIVRFLDGAQAHLEPDGTILLLFSTLTNKELVEQAITRHYAFSERARLALFFEQLFVYELRKKHK